MIDYKAWRASVDDLTSLTQWSGKVKEISEVFIRSYGPKASLGELCQVDGVAEPFEVVHVNGTVLTLMPYGDKSGITVGSGVRKLKSQRSIPIVESLLGRVVSALGEPIDDHGAIGVDDAWGRSEPLHPLKRERVKQPIQTGVKVVDSMLTIGRGQKIGIFAGTGVGKSTLLGMIAKRTSEQVNVIALIGERGREVREFIEKELGEDGLKRSVLVVSTSDESPLMHLRAAELATSIAERFRDRGNHVLLMMDSITRFSMARRTFDIATGDIPVAGGKTLGMEPSLQKLLERAGANEKGSITGIYTVLVENDDFNGPIPDMARGILDGHIVLTRKLADQGHFPAVDVLSSVSRVMQDVADEEHLKMARLSKKYMALYEEKRDQFDMGLIEVGRNVEVDKSMYYAPHLLEFFKQERDEGFDIIETLREWKGVIG